MATVAETNAMDEVKQKPSSVKFSQNVITRNTEPYCAANSNGKLLKTDNLSNFRENFHSQVMRAYKKQSNLSGPETWKTTEEYRNNIDYYHRLRESTRNLADVKNLGYEQDDHLSRSIDKLRFLNKVLNQPYILGWQDLSKALNSKERGNIKMGNKNNKNYRDTGTGKFVTKKFADGHPKTTVGETKPPKKPHKP